MFVLPFSNLICFVWNRLFGFVSRSPLFFVLFVLFCLYFSSFVWSVLYFHTIPLILPISTTFWKKSDILLTLFSKFVSFLVCVCVCVSGWVGKFDTHSFVFCFIFFCNHLLPIFGYQLGSIVGSDFLFFSFFYCQLCSTDHTLLPVFSAKFGQRQLIRLTEFDRQWQIS